MLRCGLVVVAVVSSRSWMLESVSWYVDRWIRAWLGKGEGRLLLFRFSSV